MSLRQKRYYTPYKLTLIDFIHQRYENSTKPKNFASILNIENPLTKESRTVEISMNKPLRYKGKTYFQASYAENDTVTVLQVVQNKGWLFPYIACLIMTLGLCIHFIRKGLKK